MYDNRDNTMPSPNELQKELTEFFRKKFGYDASVGIYPQQDEYGEKGEPKPPKNPVSELEFEYTPREIKEYLDRFVIRQEEAKKVLSIAVCDHYNHAVRCSPEEGCGNYAKQNIILIGPTGVGKTYLVRCIAKLIGVPFVKADATKFSETGYVGGDVEDLVRELVHQANGNIALARYGIIYIDEIDKIASATSGSCRDVSGRGVQTGLLKLMEETEVPLRSPMDLTGQLQAMMEFQKRGNIKRTTINTRHILFIVSGAFDELETIVKKRINRREIGFAAPPKRDKSNNSYLQHARTRDFIRFGLEPEFIGRLPVRVVCEELTMRDLYEILTSSEDSIITQYKEAFNAFDIQIVFSDSGLKEIAKKASREETGARGLMTVCERTLRDFKFELPSTNIRHLVVTRAIVNNPTREAQKLATAPARAEAAYQREMVRQFEREFQQRYGITITLDRHATKDVVTKAHKHKRNVKEFCRELLANFEHGLDLIRRNSGQTRFAITSEVIETPDEMLNKWIRESYRDKE